MKAYSIEACSMIAAVWKTEMSQFSHKAKSVKEVFYATTLLKIVLTFEDAEFSPLKFPLSVIAY